MVFGAESAILRHQIATWWRGVLLVRLLHPQPQRAVLHPEVTRQLGEWLSRLADLPDRFLSERLGKRVVLLGPHRGLLRALCAELVSTKTRHPHDHEFEVIAYCVMPDHFHALVGGRADRSALAGMTRFWKQVTGYDWRRRHADRLWQEGYYDRILRDDESTEGVVRYIVGNPLRAGLVDDIHDYELIGSAGYDVDALLEAAMDWSPRGRRRV